MTIHDYISNIDRLYRTGNAREHSYRGDLQNLIMTILPDVLVTNEPARVDCGAPDYVLTRKDVPVGYIEAKDIGVDLDSKTLKEQFDRYKAGLTNLIFTDYLSFHFYRDGELLTKITIAKIENGGIVGQPEFFDQFSELIKNFALTVSQTIKSPTKLAEMMAGKAKLMADIIEKSLNHDDEAGTVSPLKNQMLAFQRLLISDIDNKAFSDIYAQTIAYGMFAARYHDPTLPTFSRMEAAQLIPKSNPFLRKLFQDIAGFDLDDRLVWIVDELVSIFLASDVAQIMKNFGRTTKQEDPVIHFYETFLGAYNPALRKARGVWYTPQPVVNFIVRAVDDILKTEFGLSQGLADTSKTKIKVEYFGKQVEKEVHKVQILDPATGTGTFLAEVVKHIHKKFQGQEGIWGHYVQNDLIPRLNGFELLMASYAMAHLKMDMLLTETGYKPSDDQRFKIFLTNSLEEPNQDTGTLFSSWLSDESIQANEIKKNTPVMVVTGNPPYSISSVNKSPWIQNLIADYKKNLNEKKINLDDDYIKFIRYGQFLIEKNGSGVLAYISNNSFLSGITHREMRKCLLNSFDKIYILDLHGNSNIKELQPNGKPDQNVFDIKQGVSVNIFIKKSAEPNCDIMHFDLFGDRQNKYDFLESKALENINWKKLNPPEPYFFFNSNDLSNEQNIKDSFSLTNLFMISNSGIKTDRDSLFIDFEMIQLESRIKILLSGKYDEKFVDEFKVKDSGSYKLTKVIQGKNYNETNVKPIQYRPFDNRWIYYDSEIISRPASKVMKHLLHNENISLSLKRQSKFDFSYAFLHRSICESCLFESAYANNTEFPLYLYQEGSFESNRIPNFNLEIINQIGKGIGLTFTSEKEDNPITFAPIDILDYIYAVLHSPTYREKNKEFLKIDFPRVPAPLDHVQFWKLVKLGGELRQIHLLESPVVEKYITGYPVGGSNLVSKPTYKNGNVYINNEQYFSNVPEVAWNFYIGGYQPAQKWLKDRKDRVLGFEDILHYQKIIVALKETDRIMKEIDKIKLLP